MLLICLIRGTTRLHRCSMNEDIFHLNSFILFEQLLLMTAIFLCQHWNLKQQELWSHQSTSILQFYTAILNCYRGLNLSKRLLTMTMESSTALLCTLWNDYKGKCACIKYLVILVCLCVLLSRDNCILLRSHEMVCVGVLCFSQSCSV